ncbi:unnamed protein product [Adineta ricciae]|uniref:Uncharacterized protein n=1 Tax=Adineta ricciae TaxID=249248 RepID=A0A815S4N6_ADIRI|nr:unnamed protein product [Adineta ricciae]
MILFIDMTNSTMNNKKPSSLSFTRRRQLDENFRRINRQCEQKVICQKHLPSSSALTDSSVQQHQKELAEIDMINCVRQCISYSCYRQIYEKDPLERGEIDVRANHFKTCWTKQQKI